MKMQNIAKKILLAILSLSLLFAAPGAYAASATMSINPGTGSYSVGEAFSVDLVIDGKGDAFNAAKATIEVSQALQINDVILGDCNFSFITTPTTSNPSFVGAILGGSSQRCTVYTLTVTPATLGSGIITLSDASIKKHGNAAEILQSVQNGTYTLTGSSNSSSQESTTTTHSASQPAVQASDPGLVTLVVKAVDSENKPITGATVLLNPETSALGPENTAFAAATDQEQAYFQFQATTDDSGTAQITNVPSGMYAIEVKKNEKLIAEKIVNVSGHEPVMTLGIRQQQEEPLNWLGLTVIIVTVLAAIGFIIIYFRTLFVELFRNMFKKA